MAAGFDPYLSWLGIEPHERPVDHYRLLGLERFESRREVILAAADQRMGYIRSFQAGPRVAHTQKLLNELATAKLCLLDANAKHGYDAALQQRLTPTPVPVGYAVVAAPPLPPPVPASPGSGEATPVPGSNESAIATADPAPPDELPFYARLWFPLAILGGLLLIVGLVWGVGKFLSSSPSISQTDVPSEPAVDVEAEPPIETVVESKPAAPIEPDANGALAFSAAAAQRHGVLELESGQEGDVVSNWQSDEDGLSWEFQIKKPGIYRVEITYWVSAESSGSRYEVTIGEERRSREVRSAVQPGEFVTDSLLIVIKKSGRHTLSLRAAELRGSHQFTFKSLSLAPRVGGAS